MLDYLDAKGIKVGDDAVRLSRGIDNFLYKYDPLRMIGLH